MNETDVIRQRVAARDALAARIRGFTGAAVAVSALLSGLFAGIAAASAPGHKLPGTPARQPQSPNAPNVSKSVRSSAAIPPLPAPRTGEPRFRAAVRPRTCGRPLGDADAAGRGFGRLVIASARLRALGTGAVLCVTEPAALQPARRELVRELREVDLLASRFREDSELTALNRRAGEPVRVSRRLFDAVTRAIEVARRTGGLVDPTVGRALRLAGYDRTFVAVRARDGSFLAISHRSPGWGSVQLDPERLETRVPVGVELDLGATAKAAAADSAAAAAHEATGAGVLVSLGGDVAVAGPLPAGGWPIRIADHHDAPLASAGPVVALGGGGLATSGVAARRWAVHGGERHHIIDPRTGSSALTPWRTVTVTGATCVDANAASTAAVVLGADAPAWLGLRGLSARLLRHDGSAVFVGDWPRTEAQAA
jgi:thiamine biosynthesis lipoprotein